MAYQATVLSNRRRYVAGRAEHTERGFTELQDKEGSLKMSELGSQRLCCVPSAETAEPLHIECTGPFRDVSS